MTKVTASVDNSSVIIHSFIHMQSQSYQGQGRSTAYPWVQGWRIHRRWVASTSQGTMHTLIHIYGEVNKDNKPTGMILDGEPGLKRI